MVAAWILACTLAAAWLVLLALAATRGRSWVARRRWAQAALLAISLAWLVGLYAVFIEPARLVVRHVDIESANWSGPPLRIGLLSDTHAGSPPWASPRRVEKIVARLNAERPDLVVLLGDYVGGHAPVSERSPREQATVLEGIAALGSAEARLGTYAVLGNHDWWFDGPLVERTLTDAGVAVLENEAAIVDAGETEFWLAGLADYDSLRVEPSFAEALAEVPRDAPAIALSHRPDLFAHAPERVALTLAGHSHCGQVVLPVLGAVAAVDGARRWPCGFYEEGGRKLYVTGGAGISALPVRFGAPPEIVIVTLRAPPG